MMVAIQLPVFKRGWCWTLTAKLSLHKAGVNKHWCAMAIQISATTHIYSEFVVFFFFPVFSIHNDQKQYY
jgi:hypothetical protein